MLSVKGINFNEFPHCIDKFAFHYFKCHRPPTYPTFSPKFELARLLEEFSVSLLFYACRCGFLPNIRRIWLVELKDKQAGTFGNDF